MLDAYRLFSRRQIQVRCGELCLPKASNIASEANAEMAAEPGRIEGSKRVVALCVPAGIPERRHWSTPVSFQCRRPKRASLDNKLPRLRETTAWTPPSATPLGAGHKIASGRFRHGRCCIDFAYGLSAEVHVGGSQRLQRFFGAAGGADH